MKKIIFFSVFLLYVAVAMADEMDHSDIYYQNDFETKCDLAFWISDPTIKFQVKEIGLTSENPYQGKQCSKIIFQVREGGGWCYFKIPIDIRIEPGKTYVIDAAVRAQSTSGSVQVGFGYSWRDMIGGNVQGNRPAAGMVPLSGDWCHLQSLDLGKFFQYESVATHGYRRGYECAGRFDGLYVHIAGVRAGDKVTIWVDDVKLRAATDAEVTAMKGYIPPSYPKIEHACPWGVFVGAESLIDLPIKVEVAITARIWADFGFDLVGRTGGLVVASGSKDAEKYLGQCLDNYWQRGIRCIPSTYLTGYYNRDVPREQCESAIQRVVTRYRNHPGLFAWWMIDEPDSSADALHNWIWGRQIFESLDHEHPPLGAFCSAAAVGTYSRYTQVAVIDCYPLKGFMDKPKTGLPMEVARWMEAAWTAGARRIWAVPQAFGGDGFRIPTVEELRLMTYLYLSRGATGYLNYVHAYYPAWITGRYTFGLVDVFNVPTHLGEEVKRLADVIPALCPLFLEVRWTPESSIGLECENGENGEPIFDAALLTGSRYNVVVVCNLDVKASRVGKVIIPCEKQYSLYDLRTLKPCRRDSNVAVSLAPGDAMVILQGDRKAFAEARALVLSRRLALLKHGMETVVAEAQANGIPSSLWETALARAGQAERKKDYGNAIKQTRKVHRLAESSLHASPVYSACMGCYEKASLSLSRASGNLEVWMLRAKPVLRKDSLLMAYSKALTQLAKCQHLIRYALLNGKTEGLQPACHDLELLAIQAEANVNAFTDKRTPLTLDMERLNRLFSLVTCSNERDPSAE